MDNQCYYTSNILVFTRNFYRSVISLAGFLSMINRSDYFRLVTNYFHNLIYDDSESMNNYLLSHILERKICLLIRFKEVYYPNPLLY